MYLHICYTSKKGEREMVEDEFYVCVAGRRGDCVCLCLCVCRTFRGKRTWCKSNENTDVGDSMFPFLSYHEKCPIPCHKHKNKIRVDDQCVCEREREKRQRET